MREKQMDDNFERGMLCVKRLINLSKEQDAFQTIYRQNVNHMDNSIPCIGATT